MSSSKAARFAVVALVAVLAACLPATPSGAPPSSGTAAPSASGSAGLATPTAPPSMSPSPTTAGDGWSAIAVAQPQEIGAALTAVAGDQYAVDPAAGFRLATLGDVPVDTLLARLRIEPAFDHTVALADDGRSAVLRPSRPLQARTTYRFTLVDQAGIPLTGWAFEVAGAPRVVGTIPADEATQVPLDTAVEITFDRDDLRLLAGEIVLEPLPRGGAVAVGIEMHGRAAVLVPRAPLEASRVYRVTVRAGAAGAGLPAGLASPVTFTFATVGRPPAEGDIVATLREPLVTVLPGDRPLLPVNAWLQGPDGDAETRQPIQVRVYRLASEAVALRFADQLLGVTDEYGAGMRPAVDTTGLRVVFAGRAPIVDAVDGVHLSLPMTAQRGWYLAETRESGRPSQALLQVTNLLAFVGARSDRILAWVNDAHTGGPVRNATASIVGGSRLGQTDARGIVTASTPAGLDAPDAIGPVLVVVAARDGRRVVVPLGGSDGLRASDHAGEASETPGLARWWSALALDRSLYRSTDTVQVWGYLRARGDGLLPQTVRVRLAAEPSGSAIESWIADVAAALEPTGAFSATIPLAELPYGVYRVHLVANGDLVELTTLEVGDLRKPAYRLTLEPSPRAWIDGTAVTATATARFFEGTPAAGVPLRFSILDSTAAAVATTTTAGVATATLRPSLDEIDADVQYGCPELTVRTDRAVEADLVPERTVCIFRGAELVDLDVVRTGASVVISGAVHAVDLAAVEADLRADREVEPRGDAVRGRRVELRITERVQRRTIVGSTYDPVAKRVFYEYGWEEVRSSTTTRFASTARDGGFRLTIGARANRAWTAEAVIRDAAGREMRADAGAWLAAQTLPTPTYSLVVDGSMRGFAVGETVRARILRDAADGRGLPVGGFNRYLFVVASPGRLEPIVRSTPNVGVRFGTRDEPNLEILATWFSGRGYGTFYGADARLRTADRTVAVALTADKDRYEPGATARVSVRTADANGRPVPATVLVRGVDAKLVAMGVAAFDDPTSLIYRALEVGLLAFGESHPIALYGPGGQGSTGGGGGPGDRQEDVRADFRDDLPIQVLTTNAAGRAEVSLTLPDDLTTWRIGGTALTANRLAGAASIGVPVGLPFFVEATLAPEYLVGDRTGVRLAAYGAALKAGEPVRFTVGSTTLGMAPVEVAGTAFVEVTVPLPALAAGTQRVEITATSAVGADRLARTFRVVASRLSAGRRETIAITAPVEPPGGPGLTTLVLADAGRARYLAPLEELAASTGARSDERLAATIATRLLVDHLGVSPDRVPSLPFTRSVYQGFEGGLAILAYGSPDLELTVRALLADPASLEPTRASAWLRGAADAPAESLERRVIALVGLAALGEPVLRDLRAALGLAPGAGRIQAWAAIGLAALGDRGGALAIERDLLQRWGERRGDLVRLRIGDDAESVSEATELFAVLASAVGDPLAADALAYVTANLPWDDLPSLAQVTVMGRLLEVLPAAPASVVIAEGGVRRTAEIPAGGTVTLQVLAARRSAMRLEPATGSVAVTALWEDPAGMPAELGRPNTDLALTRAFAPSSPVPANGIVRVALELTVTGPTRAGEIEVVDLLPSGLAALPGPGRWGAGSAEYEIGPALIEGQRILFTVSFGAREEDDGRPIVPGTFHLVYFARVVTPGTYAWQPAVAREVSAPGLVTMTPGGSVELR